MTDNNKDNKQEINILLGFNDAFLIPVKVMLRSLIDNETKALHIFVAYSDLSEASIKEIEEFRREGAAVDFIRIGNDILERLDFPVKETFFRLFAHTYIDPSIDRILWLDGDSIVINPIWDFYSQDFEGNLFAAVKDMSEKVCAERKNLFELFELLNLINYIKPVPQLLSWRSCRLL